MLGQEERRGGGSKTLLEQWLKSLEGGEATGRHTERILGLGGEAGYNTQDSQRGERGKEPTFCKKGKRQEDGKQEGRE